MLSDDWLRCLACAAIEPGLRSVLLLEVSPEDYHTSASALEKFLKASTARPAERVTLNSVDTDDDLWMNLRLEDRRGGTVLIPKYGRLSPQPGAKTMKFVCIPDLARLSLAAQRACIALMAADVGTLERHGHSLSWPPSYCWLACCARSRIGEVSPHLLDRFALRISSDLAAGPGEASAVNSNEVPGWTSRVRATAARWAVMPPAVISEAIASLGEIARPRREQALCRMARALARLDEASACEPKFVHQAAGLLKIRRATRKTDTSHSKAKEHENLRAQGQERVSDPRNDLTGPPKGPTAAADLPIQEPDSTDTFEAAPFTDPFPEDVVPCSREIGSMRLPAHHGTSASTCRGAIVGTKYARNLTDIAWVPTILEAARFQTLRRRWTGRGDKCLILTRDDLRAWRRIPPPAQCLIVVLDHTCLGGVQWETAILPHLHWAYIQRASVSLVQVGMSSAAGEDCLRAHKVDGRNLLAPQIRSGFAHKPGTATPLAHGLAIALSAGRHVLQHGRSRTKSVRLVAVTDGRGNVPLQSSLDGLIDGPVGPRGVEDALRIGSQIGEIQDVAVFLLHPRSGFRAQTSEDHLVTRLARAMRADRHEMAAEGR
jgi:magnesium chelatase subunit D